jgi:hypothetical protein
MVLAAIDGHRPQRRRIVIEPDLCEGGSTASPRRDECLEGH